MAQKEVPVRPLSANQSKVTSCQSSFPLQDNRKRPEQSSHLQDLESQLQQKDNEIASLGACVTAVNEEYHTNRQQLTMALEKSKAKIQRRESELAKAQAQINSLKADLEKCKERIFNMQPLQGMPETQLAELYKDLCQSIEVWVESCFGDVNDAMLKIANAHSLEDVLFPVDVYLAPNEIDLTMDNPANDMIILASFVFRILYAYFFDVEWVDPAISYESNQLLSQILRAMSNLQPRKGKTMDAFLINMLIPTR